MLTYLNCNYQRPALLPFWRACIAAVIPSRIVERHKNKNKLRVRLRAFRTFKLFARKDSRTTNHPHEVLANFHEYSTHHQLHTNQPHTTLRHSKNAGNDQTAGPATPATPPKGGKTTKIPPSKQNSNYYHLLNNLIFSDYVHDDHDDSHTNANTSSLPFPQVPKIANSSYLAPNNALTSEDISELKSFGITSPEIIRIRKHNNQTNNDAAPASPPKGGKSAKIPPRKLNPNPYHHLNDSTHSAAHEALDDDDSQPVNQLTSYRSTDVTQQPSVMDRLKAKAQQNAKQTADNKQKAWEQKKNETSQAPKKRVNAEDLFNLAKKPK